jgi:pilus assembly protein CpaE
MHQAIDQGVSLAAVRRGSKIEAAIDRLAEMVAPTRVAAAVGTGR